MWRVYVRSLGLRLGDVSVLLDVDDLRLYSAQAVPCGLSLKELLTNAQKPAFPGGCSGNVRVTLAHAGESAYLEVRNNGVSFASGCYRSGSLGIELVSILAEQLGD